VNDKPRPGIFAEVFLEGQNAEAAGLIEGEAVLELAEIELLPDFAG